MRQYRFDVLGQKLRFFDPSGKMLGERELSAADIDNLVTEVEDGYRAASPSLAELGHRLFTWLDDPSKRWLAEARRGTPGLTIHIHVKEKKNNDKKEEEREKKLRHLPWELLCEDGLFLCTTPAYPFTPVRRVGEGKDERTEPANRPLRALFMACSPEGVKPVLHFEDEEARILEATRTEQLELIVEESGSLLGLGERREWHGAGYFDVFHLTGHADVGDDERPFFWMEDELGDPARAYAEDIAASFGGHWPRLIFLSGCNTGQAPGGGAFPSLCEKLVEAGATGVWPSLAIEGSALALPASRTGTHPAWGQRITPDGTAACARTVYKKHLDNSSFASSSTSRHDDIA